MLLRSISGSEKTEFMVLKSDRLILKLYSQLSFSEVLRLFEQE